MPHLLALDYSYNYVTSVESVMPSLITLQSLKALWLAGNPCSLQRCYHARVADECKAIETVDGLRVRQDETERLQSQTKNFDDLMECLFKEDREKAAAKAEAEKNAKKGPQKDDKKKDDKNKKEDKPTPATTKPQLMTMGSIDLAHDQLSKFEQNPDVKYPFKLLLSIRTLEKAETVFFEELADDPNLKKEDFQACFWLEFAFSRRVSPRWEAHRDEGPASLDERGDQRRRRAAPPRL